MKKLHTLLVLLATLLLAGCASHRHSVVQQVPRGGYTPPADGIKVNFGKMRKSHWHYPIPGAHVISPFGGKRPNHKGTDIKTRAKDKVRAAFDGIVTFAGTMRGYGYVVFISHPNGLETRYAHNTKNLVKQGKHVSAGEVIALEGRTGNASTEHVHFEMRAYGQAFDSGLVFDHNANQLRKVTLTAQKNKGGNVSIKVK